MAQPSELGVLGDDPAPDANIGLTYYPIQVEQAVISSEGQPRNCLIRAANRSTFDGFTWHSQTIITRQLLRRSSRC